MDKLINQDSIGPQLMAGIQKAIDKMLVQKAKDGLDVVIAGPDGNTIKISAKEALKRRGLE